MSNRRRTTSRPPVRGIRLMLLVLTGAIGATALVAGPALAQDGSAASDDQIVLTGRLVVAEDETVEPR